MKKLIIALVVILVLGIALMATGPFYTLDEGELAVVVRLGKIVSVPSEAGLHFKSPFLDVVHKYHKRILSWDGERQRILTKENQYIWVDSTARWRISDAAKFFTSIGPDEASAYGRLSDIIDSAVRTVIAENWMREIVRNSNRIQQAADAAATATNEAIASGEQMDTALASESQERIESIEKGRDALADAMLALAQQSMAEFGIELIDVIPRQIKYSDELTQSVYNRMITERNQIAQAKRSEGEGKKAEWLGKLVREKLSITSEAYSRAEKIKGDADARATRIYAQAYSRDAEFFNFWRSLESYRQTLPGFDKTLSTDMDYFRYLYSPGAR